MLNAIESNNKTEQIIEMAFIQTALYFKREHGLNSFKEITNQYAEKFRNAVLDQIRKEVADDGIVADDIRNYDYGNNFPEPYEHLDAIPYHAWIRYNDKVYDLQAPRGVDHWSKLPFYIEQAARLYISNRNAGVGV